MPLQPLIFALLLLSALTACGGGGGGSGGGSSPTPPTTPDDGGSDGGSDDEGGSDDVVAQACGVTPPTEPAEDVESLTAIKCITVDQIGYLTNAPKVAVLRDPQQGFDADLTFTPGTTYNVVNTETGDVVFSGAPTPWNDGATNTTSGDQVWWFDFSSVTTPGSYVVVDSEHNLRSNKFNIGDNLYRPLLIEATRTFFYQRAGHDKHAPFADTGWTDDASHLGEGQDTEARLYNATGDASTERDLRGGWYDAGDFNKYSNWHAGYLISMMHMYQERPSVWTDDFNIPESGNGLPDLVDEIKWGMDWMVRMQEDNGAVLSIMGLDGGSPPSAADGASTYGPASTSATLSAAAAFAFGADFFTQFDDPELENYAQGLQQRAEDAWSWAIANPSVTFENSGKVGAGEQEVDAEGRANKKLVAAIHLFALTGEAVYQNHVDENVPDINWVAPWNEELLNALLFYAQLENATASVAADIENGYVQSMQSVENWAAVNNQTSAYRAYIGDNNYTWGSNRTMAMKGATFYHLKTFNLGDATDAEIESAALGYLNYIHGVNAMGKFYLSNMAEFGAEDSVTSFYHTWFTDGSADWDSTEDSNFGPAPGFVVGGANPQYNWDNCCPDGCGDSSAQCGNAPPSPPHNQPPMKSYKDFNTSWPINSWEVTENANGYQLAYMRLLSKFVD